MILDYLFRCFVLCLFLLPFQEIDTDNDPVELLPETLEFGKVFDGDSPLKQVVLRNHGEKPLSINRIGTTCGCAVPRILFPGGKEVYITKASRSGPLGVLQAGEEARIEVTFQTWGYKGKLDKRIDIDTDAEVKPRRHVNIVAEIVDSVRLDPPVLDLGEVVRGEKRSAEIRVHSLGIGDFDIRGIKNLPSYLSFKTERLAEGDDAAHRIEIQTREAPPLGEWSLILQVALKNEFIDVTRVVLQAEILPKVRVQFNGDPIEEEVDFGRFEPRAGKSLAVDLVNLAPEIPYTPLTIHFENQEGAGLFTHRLETVIPGDHYRLHLTISPGAAPASFVRDRLVIRSEHPDMLEKTLELIGWAARAGKAGRVGG